MHYSRQRTNGTFDKARTRRDFYVDRGGYIRITAPGHFAASKTGTALQHRVFFYDAHGAGPFSCHWCGKTVQWSEMHVDHLNACTSDNRLENLAASCPPCNTSRGLDKMRATMIERHAETLSFNGVTQTLTEWAAQIGIVKESLKWRLATGWPLERALSEPRGIYGPRASR